MFLIRDMTAADAQSVLPMVHAFYQSPAVEHPVEDAILERAFQAAINPEEPLLRGLTLEEDGVIVGYSYLTECYSAECAGRVVLMEELYFQPECRGKGYGSQVFEWVMAQYPKHARFRLEVTEANKQAAQLYKRWGFRYLDYGQMVLENMQEEA